MEKRKKKGEIEVVKEGREKEEKKDMEKSRRERWINNGQVKMEHTEIEKKHIKKNRRKKELGRK